MITPKVGDVVLIELRKGLSLDMYSDFFRNRDDDCGMLGIVEENRGTSSLFANCLRVTIEHGVLFFLPGSTISKLGAYEIVENLGPLEDPKPTIKPCVFQYQIQYSRGQGDSFVNVGMPYDKWSDAVDEATSRYHRNKDVGFQYQIIGANSRRLLWSSETNKDMGGTARADIATLWDSYEESLVPFAKAQAPIPAVEKALSPDLKQMVVRKLTAIVSQIDTIEIELKNVRRCAVNLRQDLAK
jgi:hypothetical protein